MGSTETGKPTPQPTQRRGQKQLATWWAAALVLMVILGAAFLGPLSADPRFDVVLPERELPSQPAQPSPGASPIEQPQIPEPESDQRPAYIAIAIIVVLAVVAAFTAVRFLRRMKPKERGIESTPHVEYSHQDLPQDAPSNIASHFKNAREQLDARQGSSDAILRCWLELEAATELAGLPRRPAETPSEFTAAVLLRFEAPEPDTAILLSLYERVRFATSPHRRMVNPEELNHARAALQHVEEAVKEYLERRGAHAAR